MSAAVVVGRKLVGSRGMMYRWIVETLIMEFWRMSSFSLILEVGWLDVSKDIGNHQIQWFEWDDERSGFHWSIDYIGSGCGS